MAGSRVEFQFDAKTLTANVKSLPKKIDKLVEKVAELYALRGEAYMKKSAKWTDRSGNARNSLTGRAFHEAGRRHTIIYAHGMPYGIWLEVRFSGRYAIISPTLNFIKPQVMKTLDKGMTRLGGTA